MFYYIIADEIIHDKTDNVETAIYSCHELEKDGKTAYIAQVVATFTPKEPM